MSDFELQENGLEREETRDMALNRLKSSSTVMMSPELFEKLYLSPQTSVKGDLRKTFANPTPLGLLGFVLGLTPLSCTLMGWRGAGGLGAGIIGVFYFLSGPLLIFSGILEFFLGNSFTFIVFCCYGCIYLAFAGTLHPFYGSAAAYSKTGSFAEGLTEPAFNATLAFFAITMSCMNIFFMICATKINAVFFLLFMGAGTGFLLFASCLWALADGAVEISGKLLMGTGATWFVTAMLGWYLVCLQLLGIMEFEVNLPVGDFSRFWGKKDKAKKGTV